MTQLDIEGIGQQKMTLGQWKKDNDIFTHYCDHAVGNNPWSCWGGGSCPEEFVSKCGYGALGYGDSEKEAILEFCDKHQITPPFWW